MKFLILFLSFLSSVAQADRIDRFTELYAPYHHGSNDLMAKITNNRGDGNNDVYGTRNMRVVLHGVLYRGGSNNKYNKYGKRENSNPMPRIGMDNLCHESFGTGVYLYSINYKPYMTTCASRNGMSNTFTYKQISVLNNPSGVSQIIKRVHQCATGRGACPIYVGCYNGYHASGFISAVALKQFCGFTSEQAIRYWNDGTDGNNGSQYNGVRARIRAYKPVYLPVNPDVTRRMCPQNIYR